MALDPNCPRCGGTGWVCEEHLSQPVGHAGCTGAGMPCQICVDTDEVPPMTPNFEPTAAAPEGAPGQRQAVPVV